MSNHTDPALSLITDATIDAIGVGRSVFNDLTMLDLGRTAADPIRLEQAIARLLEDVLALAQVRTHEEFCDLLRTWGNDFIELAEAALSPLVALGVVGKPLAEALAILAIQNQFPRLAMLLASAGVIVDSPPLGARFDWEALRDLLLNGPGVVSEDFWDDFLDAADPQGSGRIPALLAALLVLVPQAVTLRSGDLRVAGLEPPPVAPGASAGWQSLRQRSEGWISITLPLQTGVDGPRLPDAPDISSGMTPELAMSLLFRSQRRPSGGRTVTDFEMWVQPSVDSRSFVLPLSDAWALTVEPNVPMGLGYDGTDGVWNAAIAPRPGSVMSASTNEALITMGKNDPDRPDLQFGPPDETRLVVRDLGLDLRLREVGEPSVEFVGRAHGFGVVLTNRWFRSLGAGSLLRDGLRLDLDLDARWSEESGLSIAAEGALESRFALSLSFGKKLIVRVHSLVLRVPIRADQDHFDIRLEVRPHWSISLTGGGKGITLVMDGAGGWVGWWADPPGGDKHCVGLLPPTGIGLAVDGIMGVTGGGFLDFTGGPNDRYGGVLTLTIGPPKGLKGVTVTAFGIHQLGGAEGDADRPVTFIIVLGAKFRPGVAFGPGIVWNGVGGVFGHNRRADTDALRERLTSGAIGNVLFADDPIRNAPILLGDLAVLFPPAVGIQVFGLTAQFGWVPIFDDYLIKAAVGVILEYDERVTRVVILGSLVIHLPAGPGMSQAKLDKLLNIQVDVVGDIDPVRSTLAIDATIRRGRLFDTFTLTGDGGVRASFGDRPYLMATLGGFHPDFHPDPAVFPPLKRILLSIKDEDLPGPIDKLSVSAYLAVTTNTLQFGARLDAEITWGKWAITGEIGGDALIILPFSFDVSIYGGVHVEYRGHSLVGVDFKGGLAGPSPIVLRGEVSIDLLLISPSWSGTIQLGSGAAVVGPVISSLVPILADELTNVANLASTGEDTLVRTALPESPARPVLSPLSSPVWSQNRMPLGMPIETFEDGHLDTPQRLNVSASRATTTQLDWFSPGAFVELSDAEEMSLPSFEQHPSGIRVSAEITRSASVTIDYDVEEIRLPDERNKRPGFRFPDHLVGRIDVIDAVASARQGPRRFALRESGFRVDADGFEVVSGASAIQARLVARDIHGAVQHPADLLVSV